MASSRNRRIPSRRYRQKALNQELDALYQDFCGGSGIHAVREELCGAQRDPLAQALQLALDIEICNRRAKRLKGERGSQLYRQKRQGIEALVKLCIECGYLVEVESDTDESQPQIVYVYLPNCGQVSWHGSYQHLGLPMATKSWDGQSGSTLRKLERGIKAWRKTFHCDAASPQRDQGSHSGKGPSPELPPG